MDSERRETVVRLLKEWAVARPGNRLSVGERQIIEDAVELIRLTPAEGQAGTPKAKAAIEAYYIAASRALAHPGEMNAQDEQEALHAVFELAHCLERESALSAQRVAKLERGHAELLEGIRRRTSYSGSSIDASAEWLLNHIRGIDRFLGEWEKRYAARDARARDGQ